MTSSPISAGDQLLQHIDAQQLLDGVEQLTERLGGGSYGEVWAGLWCGAQVAVKRYRSVVLLDQQGENGARCPSPYVQKFLRESDISRSLHHPHIVQYYGLCPPVSGRFDSPGFVSERLVCTLGQRISAPLGSTRPDGPSRPVVEPLSAGCELRIARGMASGLEYLHRRHVLHRDVTLSNMLLTSWCSHSCQAKIGDVGNARVMAVRACEHEMTAIPGALAYMSPEVFGNGMHSLYGTPSDVYSLGVVLLGLVLRGYPNPARRAEDLEQLGTRDHALRDVIPPCLKGNPQDRPTAAELGRQLSEISVGPEEAATQQEMNGAAVEAGVREQGERGVYCLATVTDRVCAPDDGSEENIVMPVQQEQARDRTFGLVVHGRRTVAHFTNDNAADSQRQHIADPCATALVATSVDSADHESSGLSAPDTITPIRATTHSPPQDGVHQEQNGQQDQSRHLPQQELQLQQQQQQPAQQSSSRRVQDSGSFALRRIARLEKFYAALQCRMGPGHRAKLASGIVVSIHGSDFEYRSRIESFIAERCGSGHYDDVGEMIPYWISERPGVTGSNLVQVAKESVNYLAGVQCQEELNKVTVHVPLE